MVAAFDTGRRPLRLVDISQSEHSSSLLRYILGSCYENDAMLEVATMSASLRWSFVCPLLSVIATNSCPRPSLSSTSSTFPTNPLPYRSRPLRFFQPSRLSANPFPRSLLQRAGTQVHVEEMQCGYKGRRHCLSYRTGTASWDLVDARPCCLDIVS